jgi:hypothetical protein
MAVIMDIAPPAPAKAAGPKRRPKRLLVAGGVVGVVFLAALGIFLAHGMMAHSPVPAEVRSAVSFPIYYPRQSKLPPGYSLDTASFRLAESGVVIYSVHKGSQQLVFSEQEAPDGNVINKFTSSYIPLHNTITTDLGKAEIGAAGQGSSLQTVASLPVVKGPWLIITAPADTKQSDMQQVLQSLTK